MIEENRDTGARIPVAIVEDADVYREALLMAMESESDIHIVGAYASAEELISGLKSLPDCLVLMDINLREMSGIEAVIELKKQRPEIDVMMLTVFDDEESIFNSLRAGACGYVLKSASMSEILIAIREISQGGAPLTPRIARRVLTLFQPQEPFEADLLTEGEEKILNLLSEGKSYSTVAAETRLSKGTVQSYIKKIYRKLHVHSKVEILDWLSMQRKNLR